MSFGKYTLCCLLKHTVVPKIHKEIGKSRIVCSSSSTNHIPSFLQYRSFHSTHITQGIEEFYEVKKVNQPVIIGRCWTAPELRRKSFSDLHALWFVLYKERNLLLTDKEKRRRMKRPTTVEDESRYSKVKRSMAAIKLVLSEREKIKKLIEESQTIQPNDQTDVKHKTKKQTNE